MNLISLNIKKSTLLALVLTAALDSIYAQGTMPDQLKMIPEMTEFWEPQVKVITPGRAALAPSDALVLFDGKDLSQWKSQDGSEARWMIKDGAMSVVKGTGIISSVKEFGDFQLHLEWSAPSEITGKSQGRGNSGIFLQSRYELQVLDSCNNRTYSNGQAGSIYKQHAPLVNAMNKPGEWNIYEVIYTAPRFKDDGTLFTPARVTVLQNGVLIQNNTEIKGKTEYIGFPAYKAHGKHHYSFRIMAIRSDTVIYGYGNYK